MKKKIAVILLVMILLTISMAMLCACVDEEPKSRDVELELINPITKDIIKDGDTIDLPTTKTRIKVLIKDKESGAYLKDDDLPDNTIDGSYDLTFYGYREKGQKENSWSPYGYWPTIDFMKEKNRDKADYYEVKISFDCKPKYFYSTNYVRKYKTNTVYVRFNIDKTWLK